MKINFRSSFCFVFCSECQPRITSENEKLNIEIPDSIKAENNSLGKLSLAGGRILPGSKNSYRAI